VDFHHVAEVIGTAVDALGVAVVVVGVVAATGAAGAATALCPLSPANRVARLPFRSAYPPTTTGRAGILTLRHDPEQLICRITDTGPGMADPTVGSTPTPATATTGYGLWLARPSSGRRLEPIRSG
jgi:hypothetical protein